VFPPEGVRSIRKNAYAAITSVETPGLRTSCSSSSTHRRHSWPTGLAVDVIYPKKYLDKDPNYFKANIVGVRALQVQEPHARIHVRGRAGTPTTSFKDRPYLDGYSSSSARNVGARGGPSLRARVDRVPHHAASEVETIRKQSATRWSCKIHRHRISALR